MPYDPRPTVFGGNQGIDIEFSRFAPDGMFRVVGVDTFDGTDWHEIDVGTLHEAVCIANFRGGTMTKMYVYDAQGECVHGAGTF